MGINRKTDDRSRQRRIPVVSFPVQARDVCVDAQARQHDRNQGRPCRKRSNRKGKYRRQKQNSGCSRTPWRCRPVRSSTPGRVSTRSSFRGSFSSYRESSGLSIRIRTKPRRGRGFNRLPADSRCSSSITGSGFRRSIHRPVERRSQLI